MMSDWRLLPRTEAKWRPGAWRAVPRPLVVQDRPGTPTRTEGPGTDTINPDKHPGRNYLATPALIEAANTAIELGQPLLLTGEPGCGKSTFADHLAWQLGLPPAMPYQLRTDMSARDLFYRYDDLARFRAANEVRLGPDHPNTSAPGAPPAIKPEDFLHLAPLGLAIALAADPLGNGGIRERLIPEAQPEQLRRVVLLDEIDKAPRDVPNDLLGYLTASRMWFDLPELGRRGENISISADPRFQPIVICTSNNERALPEAFLRRCLFFEIAFPTGEDLQSIITNWLTAFPVQSNFVQSVQREAERARATTPQGAKKPGLAEVISFALALKSRGYTADAEFANDAALPGGLPDWRPLARMTLLKQTDAQDAVYPKQPDE